MYFLDFMLLNVLSLLFSAIFGFCLSVILGIEFKTRDLLVKVTIWIGLGLSIIPIIGYWLHFLGLPQNLTIFAFILLILFSASFYKFYNQKDSFEVHISRTHVFTVFLALFYCFAIVGSMYGDYIPQGSDYSFHVVLVKGIISDNSIQDSWPFFGIDVRYPQGAHLFTALVINLGNLDPLQSTIAITAFFATYSLLGIYSMTYAVTKSERIAFGSFICSAFLFAIFSLSPNHFIYWGGFSVVYGVSLVPLAVYSLIEIQKSFTIQNTLFSGLVCAAIVLSHPFSVIYVLLCWIPFILYEIVTSHNFHLLFHSGLVVLVAIGIALPYVVKYIDDFVDSPKDAGELAYREKRFEEVTYDVPFAFSVLIFIGICFLIVGTIFLVRIHTNFSFFKENSIFLLWALMLLLLGSNGFLKIHIPFWYYLRPKYFFQATFLPLSSICGYLLSELYGRLQTTNVFVFGISLTIFGSISLYFGSEAQDPLQEADKDAFLWLKNATNESDVILADNVALWIPAYAGREVFFMHLPESDDFYSMYTRKWLYDELRADPNSEEAMDALIFNNISYICMSDASNPKHYQELQISHDILSKNGNFTLVYNVSNVRIYKIEYKL